ncbi:MAG: ABC transporter permease subunit [Oscillospiraceae bacterium]|nr:ABC transporter permease subunit [Oscillospiraceae bacterium]MDD4368241.1 ABC transporter permease subunit [Oscillospiraceae bacterium]
MKQQPKSKIQSKPGFASLTQAKWPVTLVWLIGLILIWELAAFEVAQTKRTPENVLPHLYQIIAAAFSGKKVTNNLTATQVVLINAASTLLRAGQGFVIGVAFGYLLALLMSLSKIVEKIAFPYLMLIQMIPILGMAPIVLSITGDINRSRIVIAAILTFYPIAANCLAGFKAVEPQKHELMYSYGANKFQLYTKTMIPATWPYFFTGLKISAPLAITASILVDTLQGGGGLGSMLSQSLKHAMSVYVFWLIIFFVAFIGMFSFYLMGVLEAWLCPYRKWEKGGNEA